MNPTGYHVTNLVLHAIEALLLWAVLLKLRIGGAFLAALVFAVHPVNVESVAWIAQRKNLVGMLFFLLAILFYLEADREEEGDRRRPYLAGVSHWYWLSLAMFVLALLGKGSVSTLPVVLLLLAWWQRGRVTGRALARAAPFAAIAAALVLVNIWFQTHGGAAPIRTASLVERLLGAGAVVWFYLWKALLPVHLAFVYPQWHIEVGNPLWSDSAPRGARRLRGARPIPRDVGPTLLMAWAFFCAALLPVMGLTDVYFMTYSLVADHYQHIAIIGVIALAAAGWSEWRRRAQGPSRTAAVLVAVAVVGTLAWLTVRQSATYRDEETLYRATIEANPDGWLAHYNLAVALKAQGRRQEELVHLEEVVRVRPDHSKAHNNLAIALMEEGRSVEALSHAEQAVRIEPDMPLALVNLRHSAEQGRPVVGSAGAPRARRAAPPGLGRGALQPRPDARHSPATAGSDGSIPRGIAARARLTGAPHCAGKRVDRCGPVRGGHLRVRAGAPVEAKRPGGPRHAGPDLHPLGSAPGCHRALRSVAPTLARRCQCPREPLQSRRPPDRFRTGAGRVRPLRACAGASSRASPRPTTTWPSRCWPITGARRPIFHFEAAVRSKPDFLVARISLAETYARAGRLSEAVAQAQAALRMAPPDMRAGLERKIRAWQAQGGR